MISVTGYSAWKINQGIERDSEITSESLIESVDKEEFQEVKTLDAEIDTSDWKIYRNEKYGFGIKIPNTWLDFDVRERIVPGSTCLIEFGFLTGDKRWRESENGYAYIFGIWVFTKKQYEEYFYSDGSKPKIIEQNKNYVFTKIQSQEVPRDLTEKMNDRELVFGTFKFLK